MKLSSRNSLALWAMSAVASPASAFTVRPSPVAMATTTTTQLFLQDWVADLIDQELYRQGHKKEYESAWMEKNRAAVLSRMESDFGPIMDGPDETEFRMHNKDKRMAEEDPERYCADRCIATGNCDIYEDLYVLLVWWWYRLSIIDFPSWHGMITADTMVIVAMSGSFLFSPLVLPSISIEAINWVPEMLSSSVRNAF